MVTCVVIVISKVWVKNLLGQFCYVLRRDNIRHFPCMVAFASEAKKSYLYKTKNQTKNFKRTAISWHLQKHVGLIACPMNSISVAFLQVRRLKIEKKMKSELVDTCQKYSLSMNKNESMLYLYR